MSVYVGIDVHRKRSQVAVVTEDGTVQLNKNVVNGSEPFLRLIGNLPAGTPVAFEAAFGWDWLAGLLENYGFDAHLVHPAAVQGDRLGQAEERQGRRGDPGAAHLAGALGSPDVRRSPSMDSTERGWTHFPSRAAASEPITAETITPIPMPRLHTLPICP